LLLRDALKYALDTNGRLLTERIDVIHEQIQKHPQQDRVKEENTCPRYGGRGKRALRRYIYTRTQDLFKKNPGKLAKHVRNGADWCEFGTIQLHRDEIEHLYNNLWNTKSAVQQPYTGEPINPDTNIDIQDIFYTITEEEIAKRLFRIKKIQQQCRMASS
jgi:hypothetical protein